MKTLWLLLIVLALSSCSAIISPIVEKIADEIFIEYPYLEEDLETAWKKCASFKYQHETGNYWKSPKEMDHDKKGDCEDFAGWLVYHLGNQASCVMIKRKVGEDNHAVVRYMGAYIYIEPQKFGKTYDPSTLVPIGTIPELDIAFMKAEISYDAVMKLSTNFYTK